MPPEEIIEFLRSLRAVRRFAPTPIPEDALQAILDVGRWTGSAKNIQPWDLLVVENPETLQALAGLGQYAGHLAGAPLAILLVMNGAANRFDAGRLAERLMLAAWAYGIGSCIGSLFPRDSESRAKQLLGVPTEPEMNTAISFGYPADAAARKASLTPGRRSLIPMGRRPLEEVVHRERWGRHHPT